MTLRRIRAELLRLPRRFDRAEMCIDNTTLARNEGLEGG